ncbi:MAG: GyrI-like domain-containing protein [Flavobacterium sp.]
MQPRIVSIPEKKLIGKNLKMSLANNKTAELWRSFMPQRKEITNNLNQNLVSLQTYDEDLQFGNLNQEFEKWALVEVSDFENIPTEMSSFTLNGGLYAVFDYKGLPSDSAIFIYIFGTWLPNSTYILDQRPHFEILGEKYKNGDSNSEEEIWIPIKPKH